MVDGQIEQAEQQLAIEQSRQQQAQSQIQQARSQLQTQQALRSLSMQQRQQAQRQLSSFEQQLQSRQQQLGQFQTQISQVRQQQQAQLQTQAGQQARVGAINRILTRVSQGRNVGSEFSDLSLEDRQLVTNIISQAETRGELAAIRSVEQQAQMTLGLGARQELLETGAVQIGGIPQQQFQLALPQDLPRLIDGFTPAPRVDILRGQVQRIPGVPTLSSLVDIAEQRLAPLEQQFTVSRPFVSDQPPSTFISAITPGSILETTTQTGAAGLLALSTPIARTPIGTVLTPSTQIQQFLGVEQGLTKQQARDIIATQLKFSIFLPFISRGAAKKGKGKATTEQKTVQTSGLQFSDELLDDAATGIRDSVALRGRGEVRDAYARLLRSGDQRGLRAFERIMKDALGDDIANQVIRDVRQQEGIITSSQIARQGRQVQESIRQVPASELQARGIQFEVTEFVSPRIPGIAPTGAAISGIAPTEQIQAPTTILGQPNIFFTPTVTPSVSQLATTLQPQLPTLATTLLSLQALAQPSALALGQPSAQALAQPQALVQRQALQQQQQFRQQQALRSQLQQRAALRVARQIRRVPRRGIAGFLPSEQNIKNQVLRSALEKVGGVDVVVGKGIKQRRIAENLPKWRAMRTGLEHIDKNIAASFKLFPTGKAPTRQDISSFTLGNKFRLGKNDPLRIVEKKQFRLDSSSELLQIKQARKGTTRKKKR